MKYLYPFGFLACIVGANWAIERYGIVPIGFGLVAPAGVYFVGVAFTLRDATQRYLGKRWALVAIAAGAALSVFVSPAFALASGAAFALSELADFAVYTPLSKRGWVRAVVASNVVGAVVDSAVFLWLAFGSLDFITGQVVGKLYMTGLAILMIGGWRARTRSQSVEVVG